MTKPRPNATSESDPDTRCPVCSGVVAAGVDSFPFCSPRCRQIDLGRWLSEGYRITRPIEQADLEEELD